MQTTPNFKDFPLKLNFLEPCFDDELKALDVLERKIYRCIPHAIPAVINAIKEHELAQMHPALKKAFDKHYHEMPDEDCFGGRDEEAIPNAIIELYLDLGLTSTPIKDFERYQFISNLHTSEVTAVELGVNSRILVSDKNPSGVFEVSLRTPEGNDPELLSFHLKFFLDDDALLCANGASYFEGCNEKVSAALHRNNEYCELGGLTIEDVKAWAEISKFSTQASSTSVDNVAGFVATSNQLLSAIFQPELSHDYGEIFKYIYDTQFDDFNCVTRLHRFDLLTPKILEKYKFNDNEYVITIDNFFTKLLTDNEHNYERNQVVSIFNDAIETFCTARLNYLETPIAKAKFALTVYGILDSLTFKPPKYLTIIDDHLEEIAQLESIQLCDDISKSIESLLDNGGVPLSENNSSAIRSTLENSL
ncbi:hypothetical protein GCM10011607_12400 [Shewanella inventionis]|uniref:Uncharacterized protein n=1 Tax=Shewanella inventionis TaxID=1738770 RepID=A0ABQ1IYM6_9GAMM|nr:hypothetical protein [Shewanella inventionis]GGB53362.1 hypothetical protein GCM10011607_12400 [Shewanella inventionis]